MTEHDPRRKALRHLIELETSGHSEEAWARFEAWLREDPAHRIAFAKLEKAWRTVSHLQAMLQGRDPAFDRPGSNSLARLAGPESPSWRERWRSIGAGLLLLLILASALAYHYATEIEGRFPYETGPQETRTISLEDDSTITINRSTRIAVTSSWLYREVRLDHGEAAFDVSLHWPRSFLVYAGGTVLRDIGTRFDVLRVGETHVEAVVQRGSVAITTPTVSSYSSAGHPYATTEQTVGAGESAVVESGEIVRQQLSAAELERHFAWTRGMLVFDGSLADAVAEFNRYNTRQLRVVDPTLLNTRVGGRYKATDPDSFAKYLQYTHGITSKWVREGESGKDLILIGVHP
jgi:transmembrane sensor